MSSTESSTNLTESVVERAGHRAAAVYASAFVLSVAGGVGAVLGAAAALPQPAGPTRPVTLAIIGFIGFIATIGLLRHLWVRPLHALLWRGLARRHGEAMLVDARGVDSAAGRWFDRLSERATASPARHTGSATGRHDTDGGAIDGDAP